MWQNMSLSLIGKVDGFHGQTLLCSTIIWFLDKINYELVLRGGPLMFTIGAVIATCVILIKTLQFRNKMVIVQNAHFHFRAHFNYNAYCL